MSQLSRVVDKLKNYPQWVLTFAIGKTIPFVRTGGIRFETMTTDTVVAVLENKKHTRNHIGQIHAAAMILLAETATGLLVGMNIPDDKVPLIKSLKTNFVRRSTGKMQAVATITEAQKAMLLQQDKGEFLVSVVVTDESGEQPIQCEMLWAWILKKKR